MEHALRIDRRSITALMTVVAWLAIAGSAVAQNAYVTNLGNLLDPSKPDYVSVVDTATNTITVKIMMESPTRGAAVTSDGSKVYVLSSTLGSVFVIDTATNTVPGPPIPLGFNPISQTIAITPDGSKAYVPGPQTTVSVIDTASNTVTTIPVVGVPAYIAVTPDGTRAYVSVFSFNTAKPVVSVLDTASNSEIGSPISLSVPASSYFPSGVAVTPDGSNVYVGSDPDTTSTTDPGVVSVIDTTTNPNKEIATIAVDRGVSSIAITPDGSKAYVTTAFSVAVIDTRTKAVIATIPMPIPAHGIGITPDGSKAYVATGLHDVAVIDTATNTVGSPIDVGDQPYDLVIQPVPSPVPSFAGSPPRHSLPQVRHGDRHQEARSRHEETEDARDAKLSR